MHQLDESQKQEKYVRREQFLSISSSSSLLWVRFCVCECVLFRTSNSALQAKKRPFRSRTEHDQQMVEATQKKIITKETETSLITHRKHATEKRTHESDWNWRGKRGYNAERKGMRNPLTVSQKRKTYIKHKFICFPLISTERFCLKPTADGKQKRQPGPGIAVHGMHSLHAIDVGAVPVRRLALCLVRGLRVFSCLGLGYLYWFSSLWFWYIACGIVFSSGELPSRCGLLLGLGFL